MLCVGPNVDDQLDHHNAIVPNGLEDYRVALIVRNPWARLVGLWWHLTGWRRFNGDDCCGFDEFVHWVAAGRSDALSWFYISTIGEQYAGPMRKAGVAFEAVPLETLSAWLAREYGDECEPSALKFPPALVEWRRPWRQYWNDERRATIAAWASVDAGLFGYTFECDLPTREGLAVAAGAAGVAAAAAVAKMAAARRQAESDD